MKPGYIDSLLHKTGIIIAPQPIKYRTELKIKVTKRGKEVKGSDKVYTPKDCFKQIDIIKEYYYNKLTEKI